MSINRPNFVLLRLRNFAVCTLAQLFRLKDCSLKKVIFSFSGENVALFLFYFTGAKYNFLAKNGIILIFATQDISIFASLIEISHIHDKSEYPSYIFLFFPADK